MKHLFLALLALAVSGFLPASHSAQAVRERPARGTAVIRGRVFAADTLAPIARARVSWSPTGSPLSAAPQGAMTDANGRYEIRDLPAGRYRVFARRSGYAQMDFGARRGGIADRRGTTDSERGITIELGDGQAFDAADIYLSRAGAIGGRILDEYGDPLMEAFVGVSRLDTVNGRRRTVACGSDFTDDLGEYRVFGLPPGTYYVVVAAPPRLHTFGGFTYADLFFPGVATRDQARPITIRTGQEAVDVSIAMLPIRLARVSGTVVTSQGRPPRRTTFSLARTTAIGITQGTTFETAAPDGSFSLAGIAPGEQELVAVAQTETGRTEVATFSFLVNGEDITDLLVVTGAGGQLSGVVKTDTGASLPAVQTTMRVTAESVENGSDGVLAAYPSGTAGPGTVGPGGAFVAPVRPGPRTIGLSGLPAGWGIASILSGNRNITELAVDVRPGTDVPVQIVISNRLPALSGSARDGEGKPTADFTVIVFPKDPARRALGPSALRSERPNQFGQFRVENLRPGDYCVAAVQGAEDADWTDADWLERLQPASVEIRLGVGEKKTVQLKVVRIES